MAKTINRRSAKKMLVAAALAAGLAAAAAANLSDGGSEVRAYYGGSVEWSFPGQGEAVESANDRFDSQDAIAKLRAQIKGREGEPAGQVFKNVQVLKGMPAGRLLAVMEMGYSRALGVDCTHCHATEKWEADEKTTKLVAREMIQMTAAVNTQLLKNVKNLKSTNPTVNCTTCHRGETKPALNLPAARP